jgi:hypothetical protein
VTDCATKRLWLAEAEVALHRLLTGTAEQTVTFGSGKSVTYTAASIDKLRAYIEDLRNQVAVCDGQVPCKRGPIRFVF